MWKTAKLGDVCSIINGNSIPAKIKETHYTNVEGIAYVATKDVGFDGAINYDNGISIPINEKSKFRLSPKSATLICAEGGSAGRKIAFSDRECCFVNKLFSLSPNSNLFHKFVYYYALSGEFQTQFKNALHGLIGGVSLSKIRNFEISFPSRAEQQRIVAKLDAAFVEIDKAIIATKESQNNAQALYKCHLRKHFSDGEKGWYETTVGNELTLQRGFDITKKEQLVGSIPVVSSGGVKSFHNKAMAKAPGVVIGRKGSLGTVHYLETDYWPHDTTLWIKEYKGNQPKICYFFFESLDVKSLDSGAANPALNRNNVHPIKTFWPRKEIQGNVSGIFEALKAQTEFLSSTFSNRIAELQSLKSAILAQELKSEAA